MARKNHPPDYSIKAEEMFVGLHISYFQAGDLVEWARTTAHLDRYANDWEVAELLSYDVQNLNPTEDPVSKFYSVFGKYWSPFPIPSAAAELIAIKLLAYRLENYISGDCRPYDICKMVAQIEPIFDYPEWLGDLYNGCDWVEPETNSKSCAYLAEVAKNVIPTLNSRLRPVD